MSLHAVSPLALCAAIVLGGCSDEFSTTEPVAIKEDTTRPFARIMTVRDTDTIVARFQTDDRRLVGAVIRWISSDPTKLELKDLSVTGESPTDTILARTRIQAIAHARGPVSVTATVEQPGIKSFSVEDSVYIRERWKAVTAGGGYTCALADDDEAYCWGSLPVNTEHSGMGLGDGSTAGRSKPTRVLGGVKFKAISAGDLQTCGIARDTGQLYCWGRNVWGELGDGTFADALVPQAALGGHSFAQISTSSGLTCGVTDSVFLEGRDGNLLQHNTLCWGRSSLGGLGHGDRFTDSLFSVPCRLQKTEAFLCMPRLEHGVTASGAGNILLQSVSVGNGFACGLAREGLRGVQGVQKGAALCWGPHDAQQLGQALTLDIVGVTDCEDTDSVTLFPTIKCSFNPLRAVDGILFSALSSGGTNTCGISEGQVYCWGGVYGATPKPINGPAGAAGAIDAINVGGGRIERFGSAMPFVQVDELPFVCALAAGQALCWGDNVEGELGSGEDPELANPVPHREDMQMVHQDTLIFTAVSAGARLARPINAAHACALTEAGAIFCWGSNRSGALGMSPDSGKALTPVRIEEPES